MNKKIYLINKFEFKSNPLRTIFSKLSLIGSGKTLKDNINLSALLFLSFGHSVLLRVSEKFDFIQRILIPATIEYNGIKYHVESINHIHYVVVPHSQYELNLIGEFTDKNSLFVDVGGFIGTHALSANGKAITFEPNPSNYKYLLKNIELNDKDVEAFQAAVSDKSGHVYFQSPSFSGSGKISSNGGIKVKSYSIDDLKLRDVSMIKIDVEGAEMLVLTGAINTIKKYKPVILFEALNEEKLQEIIDFLEKLGYHYFYKLNYLSYLASTKDESTRLSKVTKN